MCGLRDGSIQRTLLSEANLTLTKTLVIEQSVERAQKELKESYSSMQSENHRVNQIFLKEIVTDA